MGDVFDFEGLGQRSRGTRQSRTAPHRRTGRRTPAATGVWPLVILAGAALGLGASEWADWRAAEPMVLTGSAAPSGADTLGARFALCERGGGANCVVDGDTFRFGGEKIRVADIDTPETHPPRCAAEAELGDRATKRLHTLLNAGPFTLKPIDRDTDRYGRKLRIVTRDGQSLGDVLVREGLARRYTGGPRAGWCA